METLQVGFVIDELDKKILETFGGNEILCKLERCGRICYLSAHKIASESAPGFIRKIIDSGHESVIEHFSFTVRFICDRGISHEIVRHRLASYSQESTRYCDYREFEQDIEAGIKKGGIRVIKPFVFSASSQAYMIWKTAMENAEGAYKELRRLNVSPQWARSVLPHSLKTEIVVTCNLREWRHFFRMRCSPAAHPQIREIMNPLLKEVKKLIPVVFDDMKASPLPTSY